MKTKILNSLLIIVSLVLLSSCEDMISDVDVPLTDPKLVVYSVISPQDQLIKVKVTQSLPIYSFRPHSSWDDQFPVVKNANVTISDGSSNYTLTFDPEQEQYVIDSLTLKITAGTTYSLKVKTPDGSLAAASCTVPLSAPSEIEITGVDFFDSEELPFYFINFRFLDLPGEGQYYSVFLSTWYYYGYGDNNFYVPVYLSRGDEIFSDRYKEGSYFNFRTSDIYYDWNSLNQLNTNIFVTDEAYFNYHRSINDFQDDNPFAEPTPVFSNISGGLGVFSAVNGRLQTFDIGDYQP